MRDSRFVLMSCAALIDGSHADLRVVYRVKADLVILETLEVTGYTDPETEEETRLAHPRQINRDRLFPSELRDIVECCAADFKRRKTTIDKLYTIWPLPWSSRAG